MRSILIVVAWASVIVGCAGVFVPLLPTTPFLLLSAGIFARTSPRFEAWLLSRPTFGEPILAWRQKGAIPMKAKLLAVTSMLLSLVILLWLAQPRLALAAIIAMAMISCALFVVTRPSD
ncbi:YbaN family protein [Rhizobium hidalgonense]|uniref:YbaN family protein n=1 Tax=Rhizobium hidalgonense TaxID=1538159 RepID=UPI002871950E|nr:DUF454 family protein [Rhizobium hidalgonense]MDR9808449.1 DUF454 family protein [Rhizobium hidalgonense]